MLRALAAAAALLLVANAGDGAGPQTAPDPHATPYVKNPANWPTPIMDGAAPKLPRFTRAHAVLVLSKTNGFRDTPQILAANKVIARLVKDKGWDVYVTENAAVFNPAQLAKFDTIVLNSTSGNIFTDAQRDAFRIWLARGGGLVALHGAGGDTRYDWAWWPETALGVRFVGHTARPNQFQQGVIRVAEPRHPVMAGIPAEWQREEEWYAFDRVPSGAKTRILARLDEKSYTPTHANQVMGDHPVIWTRCIGRGRLIFSALGHKAETYAEPLHQRLIANAIGWAAEARVKGCD